MAYALEHSQTVAGETRPVIEAIELTADVLRASYISIKDSPAKPSNSTSASVSPRAASLRHALKDYSSDGGSLVRFVDM